MREEIKNTLCELQERANKDIRKLLEKPDISPTEWKSAGDAVDIIKDVECAIKDAVTTMAMENEYGEESGMSERGYVNKNSYNMFPMEQNSFMSGRGRGTNTSRSGNSYRGGNSYAGEMDNAIANLRNMMTHANSESERMMYQRFIEEAERERFGR